MTDKKPDGGCAFPLAEEMESGRSVASSYGISVRDYFAAVALQGMYAFSGYPASSKNDIYAENAYEAADSMLKERAK